MPFGPKRTAGISGHYSEAWTIALRLGAEACGSRWKPVEANREPVEASGSCGRHREAVEDMRETGKGLEGVREGRERSGRGPEGRGKVQKRQEGTGSNSTLQVR